MWKTRIGTFALLALLAACVQLPPTPEDIQAKKFEAAPGKAVVYLVRPYPDIGDSAATVVLDDQMMGSTYMGTYFRWEMPPGRHRIAGYAGDTGIIMVDLQPDRVYFVEQNVRGGGRAPSPTSFFRMIPEPRGRALVMNAMLVGRL